MPSAINVLQGWQERFAALSSRQQIAAVGGVALVIAFLVALLVWWQKPSYQSLYANLPEEEAGQIVDFLQQQNTPYKIDPQTGRILVPEEEVHAVRMRLASAGLPRSGGVGFELLDKPQGFGVSQFLESTRYQRALEGELGRSVQAIEGIKAARVHLAIPKEPVFIHDTREPSASVVVSLYPGRTLSNNQVAAIRHLVSSSVVEMHPERVAIVNQRGQLLTDQPADAFASLDARRLAYKGQLEIQLQERVLTVLSPIVGEERVQASVSADLDYSISEENNEVFDPEPRALRSEHLRDEEKIGAGPMGVPGALTNQPPAAGTAPQLAAPQAQPQPQGQQPQQAAQQPGAPQEAQEPQLPVTRTTEATRNYEISRNVRQTRWPPGQVKRLTVAVVIDNAPVPGQAGERAPLNETQLQNLQNLVRQAVGYDANRGDEVTVVNAAFATEHHPWWRDPGVWHISRQVFWGVLLALLIAGVLRMLYVALRPPPVQESMEEMPMEAPIEEPTIETPPKEELEFEEKLRRAKAYAEEDPRRAAKIIKNWLKEDGRPEHSSV
jgi:flagellar M-ring protein FliF